MYNNVHKSDFLYKIVITQHRVSRVFKFLRYIHLPVTSSCSFDILHILNI